MKPGTKAFADKLLSDPKLSQTEAYIQTHRTTNRESARNSASELMAKPSVKIYLKKHEDMAKRVIHEIASDTTVKPDTRIKAAQDILDRNIGRATQKSEVSTTNLNLNIEASKELSDQFTEFIRQQTQA